MNGVRNGEAYNVMMMTRRVVMMLVEEAGVRAVAGWLMVMWRRCDGDDDGAAWMCA